jgi:FkbM family methyltransferase
VREFLPNTIFVDLGAFDGDSLRRYVAAGGLVEHAHLFEPNPRVKQVGIAHVPHTCLRVAAWTRAGNVPLYLSRLYEMEGSTLLREKSSGNIDRDEPVNVPCIDFAEWLRAFAGRRVVLKVNVEGAEYDLFEHLQKRDVLRIPQVIYLSLHTRKVGRTETDDERLRDRLRLVGFTSFESSVYDPRFFETWVRGR